MLAIGRDGLSDVGDLPVNLRLVGLFEHLVDLGEGTAAKEAGIG